MILCIPGTFSSASSAIPFTTGATTSKSVNTTAASTITTRTSATVFTTTVICSLVEGLLLFRIRNTERQFHSYLKSTPLFFL